MRGCVRACVHACACMCVCLCECARACVRACVRACLRACTCIRVRLFTRYVCKPTMYTVLYFIFHIFFILWNFCDPYLYTCIVYALNMYSNEMSTISFRRLCRSGSAGAPRDASSLLSAPPVFWCGESSPSAAARLELGQEALEGKGVCALGTAGAVGSTLEACMPLMGGCDRRVPGASSGRKSTLYFSTAQQQQQQQQQQQSHTPGTVLTCAARTISESSAEGLQPIYTNLVGLARIRIVLVVGVAPLPRLLLAFCRRPHADRRIFPHLVPHPSLL
jgi:hypothetical protein